MKKNASSIAIVVSITLILFLCHSITPAKSETGLKEQEARVQSGKEAESVKQGLPLPKTDKFNITKKSILKPISKTFMDNTFLHRFRTLPFNNKQGYRMPEIHVRKDVDYKIMNMHVRKDVDYKILDLTPRNYLRGK